MFSFVTPARLVPKDHPLLTVRELTDAALKRLSPRLAGIRQMKVRGLRKVDWVFRAGMAAYDLMRVGRLVGSPPA